MIGYLEICLGHHFLWARRIECELQILYEQIFDSPLRIKVTPPRISHMFVQGSHAFATFYAHALREWAWPRAHMNVTTFTRLLKIAIILQGACLHCTLFPALQNQNLLQCFIGTWLLGKLCKGCTLFVNIPASYSCFDTFWHRHPL